MKKVSRALSYIFRKHEGLIADNGWNADGTRKKRGRFTSSDRLTRLSRRDAYGARACKDSISVLTGDYSKDTGISATGRTRTSDAPADPSVSRTRSYSSGRETFECRLSSRQTWKLKAQVFVRGLRPQLTTRYRERLDERSSVSKLRQRSTHYTFMTENIATSEGELRSWIRV